MQVKPDASALVLKTVLETKRVSCHFSDENKRSSEKVSDLHRVTQPIRGKHRIQIRVWFWLESQCLQFQRNLVKTLTDFSNTHAHTRAQLEGGKRAAKGKRHKAGPGPHSSTRASNPGDVAPGQAG